MKKRALISAAVFLIMMIFCMIPVSADGAETQEPAAQDVGIVIESPVMLSIFAGAAIVGGAFGYWIVRKK